MVGAALLRIRRALRVSMRVAHTAREAVLANEQRDPYGDVLIKFDKFLCDGCEIFLGIIRFI